jgi:hypothetical protein
MESVDNTAATAGSAAAATASAADSAAALNEITQEFDERYSLLAEEMVNIKNMLMKLQNFTFGVNQKLFDFYEKHSTVATTEVAAAASTEVASADVAADADFAAAA